MMMKRLLLMLVALLLIFPAHAEEQPALLQDTANALYLLVHHTEQGELACGMGVLYRDTHTLLTTASAAKAGEMYAIGADGRHLITHQGLIAGSPLALMGMGSDSSARPLHITPSGALMTDTLLGIDRQGDPQLPLVTAARRTLLNGRDGVLLTAAEGLLPGAVMLGEDGGIACLVISQHGEGWGEYTALSNTALHALLTDGDEPCERIDYAAGLSSRTAPVATAEPVIEAGITEDGLVCGIEATIEDGILTVDWAKAVPEEMPGEFTAYLVSGSNPYLNFKTVRDTQVQFPVLPETDVIVWVAYSETPLTEPVYPSYDPGTILMLTTHKAVPFTDFGFTNLHVSVTPCENAASGSLEALLPVLPITREVLSERTVPVYFQTEDTYQVEAESSDHPLLITLYTPEGYTFTSQSSFYFSPSLGESDMWAEDLTPLLESYEQFIPEEDRWPEGTYVLLYCIDGQIAGEFSFELGE